MDWLLKQQGKIERKLARRRLREGGMAMYDLSSSWVDGEKCDLAAFGYSRDGKHGRKQDAMLTESYGNFGLSARLRATTSATHSRWFAR